MADIVMSRALFPESPGEPIVIRDRRVREPLELIRVIPSGGPAHRRSTFPIFRVSRFKLHKLCRAAARKGRLQALGRPRASSGVVHRSRGDRSEARAFWGVSAR